MKALPFMKTLLLALLLLPLAAQAMKIQTWTTDNGVKVLFVEAHELPIVDVRLAFRAGSARDGQRHGISSLVNGLLVEGTGKLSAEDIALGFESTGAELGKGSLRDMAWVSLRSLSDPELRDRTEDLFARVVALPSFPEDAIERDRKAMLASLAQRRKDIGSVTEDAFFAALYPEHPYAIGPHGREADLKAITRKDLQIFHRRYYVAANATLALVGDLTPGQARDYANALTRYLQPGLPAEALPPAAPPDAARTLHIPFKTTQTHVTQGLPVLTRKDPDYFPLYVGNHVLGGSGFSSRLMQTIREDRGLVYSVYSYFMPMESNGPFQMALQTRNDQAVEATELMQQQLEDFIARGPTDKELEHAKKNITGGFPLKIDSNRKIVEYLALIGFYDLPLDYLDRFNERVLAVTAGQIRDAFARRVPADRLIRVVVGEDTRVGGGKKTQ